MFQFNIQTTLSTKVFDIILRQTVIEYSIFNNLVQKSAICITLQHMQIY